MEVTTSERSKACLSNFGAILSSLSDLTRDKTRVNYEQANDEFERFSLWMGNIGARQSSRSSMSLEWRLREAKEVLSHILDLLSNLKDALAQLLEIVSGQRKGQVAVASYNGVEESQTEEIELLKEIGSWITRLFKLSRLIRQAAPTDLFTKALSRNRYCFNDQFDVSHVGEKYPKLASPELQWLRQRLGRAITNRRHYLRYIQDHQDKLDDPIEQKTLIEPAAPSFRISSENTPAKEEFSDSVSRPSTFFTNASSIIPEQILSRTLTPTVEEDSDHGDDAKSYTTISRSLDGDLDSSLATRIPKLEDLKPLHQREKECPFCFRMKTFKNEKVWRQHVFSDLRSYICTYADCDAPYFSNINDWFLHEMQNHRVRYSCILCQKKGLLNQDRYLTHIRKTHPETLGADEQQILGIARTPVEQIPAQDCPCCSEWVDRLKERESIQLVDGSSDHMVSVTPTIFKRHLASHLEQLALFAIPIGSAAEGDANSNIAVEDDESDPTRSGEFSVGTLSSTSTHARAAETSKTQEEKDADFEDMINEIIAADEAREEKEKAYQKMDKARKQAARIKMEEEHNAGASDRAAKLREQEREMERLEDEKERKRAATSSTGPSVADMLSGKAAVPRST